MKLFDEDKISDEIVGSMPFSISQIMDQCIAESMADKLKSTLFAHKNEEVDEEESEEEDEDDDEEERKRKKALDEKIKLATLKAV